MSQSPSTDSNSRISPLVLTQQTRVNSSYEARTHGGKVRGAYLGARLLPAHAASTHDDQAQAGFQADAHHRARAAAAEEADGGGGQAGSTCPAASGRAA